jgi:hypothetical protein
MGRSSLILSSVFSVLAWVLTGGSSLVFASANNETANVTSLPGELNAVPKSMDAQTTPSHARADARVDASANSDPLSDTSKQIIQGDVTRIKASLEHAQSLVKDLKSSKDVLERNRISRQINLVAHEISLEKSYLESKGDPAVQKNQDYQNLLGDMTAFEDSAKRLPSTVKNLDQEISLSLTDVKRLS